MEALQAKLANINITELIAFFDILIALAITIIVFLFRGILARIVLKISYKIRKEKGDVKESSMYKPLKIFFFLAGAYIAIRTLPLNSQIMRTATDIFKIVVMIFITKCITSVIDPKSIFFKSFLNYSNNNMVNNFICKIIRALIWIIAIFVILYINKINLNGLAAGLGIGSAVIALAAQDLVKSLLSGVAILTDKPFNIGDWIEVGDFAGSVTDITFRSTRIKTANNSVITIPNSTVMSEYVTNWNKLTSRRFDLTLNLSLQTTTEKIKKIVKQIKVVLENNPNVVQNSVQVHFDGISSCSSDIKIFLYIKEKDYIKFLDVKQDLLCDLLYLVEKENIDLAYPTQTLYVKNRKGENA
jgi:MscS family membrane protein